MRKYIENPIFSFKFKDVPKQEIQFKRVYFRKGKKYVDVFYGERTTNSSIIAIPDRFTTNLINNNPCGFTGDIKDGDYFMGKTRVLLSSPHNIYNGVAYVVVEDYKEG